MRVLAGLPGTSMPATRPESAADLVALGGKPHDVVLAPADEEHQFRAADDEQLVFLCLIPAEQACT